METDEENEEELGDPSTIYAALAPDRSSLCLLSQNLQEVFSDNLTPYAVGNRMQLSHYCDITVRHSLYKGQTVADVWL
ncbi:hypothetical protein RRG08_027369 [Elysia crispata]|uniref:Uncharacterized protein n=1 Tax=Elysia crispata TaxID=231223 RepID=A0AAE1D1I5_9GAST|nr:hypothetical protein RRG08_027369 [Elysia crispata]